MSILSVIGGNDFCIYNRPIANKLGVEVSILLGELASEQNYWTSRNHHDGFFYSTVENLMARTALSKGKIRSAVSTLSSLGILEIESRGIPRKRYFRINETVVTEFINNLSENSPVTDCFTSANCISQEDTKNESLDVSFEHAQEDSFSDPAPKSLVMHENNSNISPKSPSFQEHNPVACEVSGLIAVKNIFEVTDDIKNDMNSLLEYEYGYKTFENLMSINSSFDLKQLKSLTSWINDSYYVDGVIAVPNAKFAEIISSAINERVTAVSFDGKTLGTFGHHSDIESVHSQSNKTKRYYRKRTSICGSKENIELIKKAAAKNKLSVSRYILKTIMPLVRDELNK